MDFDFSSEDLYQAVCLKLLEASNFSEKLLPLVREVDIRDARMTRYVHAWIYHTARNHCLNALRRSQLVKKHEEVIGRERTRAKLNSIPLLKSAGPDPEQLLLEKEADEELAARMAELRARVQRVIMSYPKDYVTIAYLWSQGKNPRDIATEIHVPVQTVFRRLKTLQKAVIVEIGLDDVLNNKSFKRSETGDFKKGFKELFANSLRGTGL